MGNCSTGRDAANAALAFTNSAAWAMAVLLGGCVWRERAFGGWATHWWRGNGFHTDGSTRVSSRTQGVAGMLPCVSLGAAFLRHACRCDLRCPKLTATPCADARRVCSALGFALDTPPRAVTLASKALCR